MTKRKVFPFKPHSLKRWWRRRTSALYVPFAPGRINVTPAAQAALRAAGMTPADLLARHVRGDWGRVDAIDRRQNELGQRLPMQVRSIYALPGQNAGESVTVWVITQADRSSTRVLLAREY
jgi:hypothetical protein